MSQRSTSPTPTPSTRAAQATAAALGRDRRARLLGRHHRAEHDDLGVPGRRVAAGDRRQPERPLLLQPRGRAGDAASGTTDASSTSPRSPARKAIPTRRAYSASKAAVIGLTKSLGKELAKTGIRVNCVTPAAVRTAIFDQMTQQHIDFMLSKIPMGRFGTRRRDRGAGALARERGVLVLDRRGVRPFRRPRDLLTRRASPAQRSRRTAAPPA